MVCFSIKHNDDDGVHQSRLVLGLGCLILEKFVRIVTTHQKFCQDLICKLTPEEENKLKRGSQKRGGIIFLDAPKGTDANMLCGKEYLNKDQSLNENLMMLIEVGE